MKMKGKLKLMKIIFLTLFYNDLMSWSYVMDTAMEPLLYMVDNFSHILGPLLVAAVIGFTLAVVAIAYLIGVPYYWNKNPYLATFLILFGNYFFVNVVFHYWMAWQTDPGLPPAKAELQEQVSSVCKKCIAPKPPRTHHCSVCHRCILKMDHHCPWLNNCVGHFNHKHFFLYMVFTVLGCLFLMTFGFEILWFEVFSPETEEDNLILPRHTIIMFEAFITTGCVLFLGNLTVWHAKLIHRGETSIEAHINKAERKRVKDSTGKLYKNPYDFGPWHNWCLFLGMIDGRGWRCVLLPSTHKPKGKGLTWDSIYSCDVRWNKSPWQEKIDLKIA